MKARRLIVQCLRAVRLNRVAHRLYYDHFHGFDAATRSTLRGVEMAFDHAREEGSLDRGDYYEFGLFKGYSFWWAQQAAERRGAGAMRFFGFDSFAGLPEVDGPDKTERGDFYKGQYACGYESVRESLERAGVDWERTTLVPGFFDATLTPTLRETHGMRPVAIALIDCDLYASTVEVLRFIDSLIQPGSILVFDDWNCFDQDDNRGQRRAFSEYLSAHGAFTAQPIFSYGSWGQAFRMAKD